MEFADVFGAYPQISYNSQLQKLPSTDAAFTPCARWRRRNTATV